MLVMITRKGVDLDFPFSTSCSVSAKSLRTANGTDYHRPLLLGHVFAFQDLMVLIADHLDLGLLEEAYAFCYQSCVGDGFISMDGEEQLPFHTLSIMYSELSYLISVIR